jgi:hypothetical protein
MFYAYAAASLMESGASAKGRQMSLILGTSSLNQPLSSSDKQAVGEALSKALTAMQGHGGGSKYEACAEMFPGGKPPSDQNDPTWHACRNQFYAYAAASLVQGPISASDKQAVGEALTKALNALQGHGGGSKYQACASMFPNGKPPADQNSPTWLSCKDQFYNRGSLVGTRSALSKGPPPAEVGLAAEEAPHSAHQSTATRVLMAIPVVLVMAAGYAFAL